MKTLLAILTVLLLAGSAAAWPHAFSVVPATPGPADPLTLHVDLELSTPCYSVRNAVAYLQDGVLHIDYETYDPGLHDCITVVVPAEFELAFGPLPAGTYPVAIHERQFIGAWMINEFDLAAEFTVGAALTDAKKPWGGLKALYR